jgi:hypothetical protein
MGDWKNDRAEMEMRKSGEEIMKNAAKNAAEKEKENKLPNGWDEVLEEFSKSHDVSENHLFFDWLTKNYEAPVKIEE